MGQQSRRISIVSASCVKAFATTFVATLLFGAAMPRAASAQAWPADAAWRELGCGLVPSFDPRRDEPGAVNERDVVGDDDAPAVYLGSDATHVFFRLRVDGAPAVGDNFEPSGWGVAIDTDLDRLNYELLAIVDGTSQPDSVRLAENTTYALPGDPGDAPERTEATYPAAQSARSVRAEGSFASSFGGDPDYFVDWAIAREDLMGVGVGATTPLVLVFGTSRDGEALDADLACHVSGTDERTFARAATDPITPTGDVADADNDGLADVEEEDRGTDPNDADSDGDGYPDGVEIREGTDPQDADSVPANLKIRGGGGLAGGCALQPTSQGPWIAITSAAAFALCATRIRRSRRASQRKQ